MNEIGKFNYNTSSLSDNKIKSDNLFIAKVVSVDDSNGGGRITVRIKGMDDKINDTDLPYAFPLLQKFLNVFPNVGESVFVFLGNSDSKYIDRYYMGPIISQLQNLNNDPHFHTSSSMLSRGVVAPDTNVDTLPNAKGAYMNLGDIGLHGRNNADIILKNSEVLIRAGKHLSNDNKTFNKKNPGYISVKSNVSIGTDNNNNPIKGSVTNIVSNKINLLSYNGASRFNLTDPNSMISDTELQKIITDTQPLLYGNNTLDFLKLLISFVLTHTHEYHYLEPVKEIKYKKLNEYNLINLLAQNIRIN